ncbi:hypothetical protein AWC14_26510 [Mycobacterium kyorinense]|uniref:Uncharacterized protein n=1 Tax=Mycobacterium kyorinense TaxID=487514 RepID=A0A1X1Y4D7_9MYCO|nr:hypothetical protein AWC14_26510 [Mycobacterium kyorinense]
MVGADDHHATGLPGAPVEHRGQPRSEPLGAAVQLFDGGFALVIGVVDHHHGCRVALQEAHRGLVTADDGGDTARQHLSGLDQPNRHDVVEPRLSQ